MEFNELNRLLWSIPKEIHYITYAVLLGFFTHLILGFFMVYKKLKPHVKRYFMVRTGIMLVYLFIKANDDQYGMFDLFLPIYILSYLDGLIILNGFGFHRCQNMRAAIKRIFKFRSYDNSKYPYK